jgi:hypothetical protein
MGWRLPPWFEKEVNGVFASGLCTLAEAYEVVKAKPDLLMAENKVWPRLVERLSQARFYRDDETERSES